VTHLLTKLTWEAGVTHLLNKLTWETLGVTHLLTKLTREAGVSHLLTETSNEQATTHQDDLYVIYDMCGVLAKHPSHLEKDKNEQ
jgi:hypothetical protein